MPPLDDYSHQAAIDTSACCLPGAPDNRQLQTKGSAGKARRGISLGFTLVELVFVITILGVIAAIAAPRFLDLSIQARKGVLRAHFAALKTVVTAVNMRARIRGVDGLANSTVDIGGTTISVSNGYPWTNIETMSVLFVPPDFRVIPTWPVPSDWDHPLVWSNSYRYYVRLTGACEFEYHMEVGFVEPVFSITDSGC